jgi:hypothetical protein
MWFFTRKSFLILTVFFIQFSYASDDIPVFSGQWFGENPYDLYPPVSYLDSAGNLHVVYSNLTSNPNEFLVSDLTREEQSFGTITRTSPITYLSDTDLPADFPDTNGYWDSNPTWDSIVQNNGIVGTNGIQKAEFSTCSSQDTCEKSFISSAIPRYVCPPTSGKRKSGPTQSINR